MQPLLFTLLQQGPHLATPGCDALEFAPRSLRLERVDPLRAPMAESCATPGASPVDWYASLQRGEAVSVDGGASRPFRASWYFTPRRANRHTLATTVRCAQLHSGEFSMKDCTKGGALKGMATLVIVAGVLLASIAFSVPAWAQAPTRDISRIAGEVYRFRNNFHTSVFAVTPQGIILTDPIDAAAATWLKGELQRRFKQPVRYLIYSHDHRDHIAGGEVFADTAVVIAHEQAKADILGERRPTAVPDVTFTDRMTIELGGTTVELLYTGRNHSDNSIVVRFPKERVLYAVDFIPVDSIAFRDFPDAYMPDWIDSLRRVEALDFDILAPGHGKLGNKQHVTLFREYLEALQAEVTRYAREGKSLDEIKQLADLKRFSNLGGFDAGVALNIEGMYRMVQGQRRDN